MPAKYTKWTNIWKNLTPLDSSQLEVFLGIFWDFFIFWIQIWIINLGRFETAPNRNQFGPVWPVTAVSGPVPVGKFNPDHASQQELCPRRQQTLQTRRRIRNPHEMRHNRRRKRYPTRSTWGHMQKPRSFTHPSWQSLQIRILLANSTIRHRATRPTMSRMPVLCQTKSHAYP